jgi:FixJ family two-component response regulator
MAAAAISYVAVIDDDPALGRSFNRLLRAAGFQAVSYDSAEMFLADGHRPQFSCLVLDIQMSGISGLELHRQLAALGSAIPVIYLTALEDPAMHDAALALGCAGYFHKTDPGHVVLDAIRHAVA